MDRWAGRVALVTGASSGIGAGICRELIKRGLTVIGCARRVDSVSAIAAEKELEAASGKLHAIRCDLKVEKDILSMFEEIKSRFGRLDICVNNAGISFNSPLLTGKTEEWRSTFDVNVMALCICTREAVKLMQESNVEEGQIIHISSIGGHYIPDLGMHGIHFYCGTKFMVRALTEGLRRELKVQKSHIRISSISPGFVKTEILDNYVAGQSETSDNVFGKMEAMTPQDVADSVVHVLSCPRHVEVNDIIVRPYDQSF